MPILKKNPLEEKFPPDKPISLSKQAFCQEITRILKTDVNKQIWELRNVYKVKGREAYSQQQYQEANLFYQHYQFLSECLLKSLDNPSDRQLVQNQLEEFSDLFTPVSIQIPTSFQTATPRAEEQLWQVTIEARLETYSKNVKTYNSLIREEHQDGVNNNGQIIPLLKEIINALEYVKKTCAKFDLNKPESCWALQQIEDDLKKYKKELSMRQ